MMPPLLSRCDLHTYPVAAGVKGSDVATVTAIHTKSLLWNSRDFQKYISKSAQTVHMSDTKNCPSPESAITIFTYSITNLYYHPSFHRPGIAHIHTFIYCYLFLQFWHSTWELLILRDLCVNSGAPPFRTLIYYPTLHGQPIHFNDYCVIFHSPCGGAARELNTSYWVPLFDCSWSLGTSGQDPCDQLIIGGPDNKKG